MELLYYFYSEIIFEPILARHGSRTVQIHNVYLYTEPKLAVWFAVLKYKRMTVHHFGAVRFVVLNTKRLTLPILVRYGSRTNTKKQTVKIKGSVRFTLPTVGRKNGTVTVAISVKNGTVKITENGVVRYGTLRYGTDTMTNSNPLLYKK